jgi:hypothetical protein
VAPAVGDRLGHFEILAPLGAGGMGVVYRARDARLGRDVALKVLPEAFARDTERLSRFEREARILATLSHPGIAAIHGLEPADDGPVLVMELVEGEGLDERLARGRLPVRQALELGRQMAAALESAHGKGIIHRDLKPSNIQLTPEGQVKLLDFGLAKALAPGDGEAATGGSTDGSTTATGVVVGTAPYMSPEQARGEALDRRTDVWSFGCVLYEMLTGGRTFPGRTAEAVAAVLEREPVWQALPAETPAKVVDLLRRCLQKNRSHRLHDIADARIELEEALAEPAGRAGVRADSTSRGHLDRAVEDAARSARRRWALAIAASGAVVGAVAIAVALASRARSEAPRLLSRFPVTLPPAQAFERVGDMGSAVAISRDGRQIVYVARDGEVTRLFHRPIDALEAELIPGTEGARMPFFSPDGSADGFYAAGHLRKVLARGGAPIDIADAPLCYGGHWSRDGAIVYGLCSSGITRVPATGGTPDGLTRSVAPAHHFPQFVESRNAVLFTEWHAPDDMRIAVLDLETGKQRVVIDRGTAARFVPTGQVVYAWAGDLWAVPFDLERLEATGAPVRVVDGVLMEAVCGAAHFDVSDEGTLVYLPGSLVGTGKQLAWVDPSGSIERLPVVDVDWSPRASPDGERLLFTRESGGAAIWVHELARGVERKLSTEEGAAFWAAWTPDGGGVVFNLGTVPPEPFHLFTKPADGSRPARQLTDLDNGQVPYSLSADGATLAFTQSFYPKPGSDIWTLSLTGDSKARPFLSERFNEVHPALSPDGKWMAYASDESGRYEVSTRPFPGPGALIPISADGGWEPAWSRDGKTLHYRNLSGDTIMAVSFDTAEAAPRPGRSTVLARGRFQGGVYFGRNYDVAPDGRFLVIIVDEPPPSPREYRVVLNWFEELKRLVPTN